MADEKGTRIHSAIGTTDVIRPAEPLGAFDAQQLDHLSAEPPAPYVKEPLFSKRVLVGWALGTLVAWFGLTVIVPAVVQSVRSAVVSSITPQDDGTTTIETRNRKITIRRGPDGEVTIERGPREPAVTVPAPVVIPPAEPLPPLPPAEATGKK